MQQHRQTINVLVAIQLLANALGKSQFVVDTTKEVPGGGNGNPL